MKFITFYILISGLVYTVQAQQTRFYTGTTNHEVEQSVALCQLDEAKGTMQIISRMEGGQRPGYIALSKDGKHLYAVSSASFQGKEKENSIHAFALTNEGKKLQLLNTRSSKGSNPCHISINPVHDMVYAANYTSGSIVSYTIEERGSLSEPVSSIQHTGSGPDTDRQQGPHAHYIHASPDGKFVYVADLGIDKIMIYKQEENGKLVPNEAQEFLEITPGAGPRHLALHPNGKWLFILNELNSTVVSCERNEANGSLKLLNSCNTLAPDETASNKAAAIRIHPDGNKLYCSNRGANTIVQFEIAENGMLKKKDSYHQSIGVVRDFNISPSGRFLIAGNQEKNELVLFRIRDNGDLQFTGSRLELPNPSCVVFFHE